MGRFDLGAVAVYAAVACLLTVLQPAGARAQWNAPPEAAQPTAAPEPPPPAPPTPHRKPWREAMDQAPAPEADTPANTERVWYGWQTLTVDVSGIAMIAFTGENEVFGVTGLFALGLGAPIVHWAHGNTNGGLISFGIRASSVGLLFLGAFLVADDIFDEEDLDDDSQEVLGTICLIASIAGGITAAVLDAGVFGYDTKRREPRYTNLAPWIDPQRGNYGLRFGIAL
jgi:hypothetical protein